MQLVRQFSSLADTYGHIMRTKLAEVDLSDVVLNRRILAVLLPAFEKSPDELSNLGKIIIGTLKAMMAAGLGDSVEGEYHDFVERKPTNAETPFLCILDEYGYYAVEGFAVVPAQARSFGFSVVFSGQDLPAFQKASKEEAASIGANTNIKICMKLEDPTETWDFFMKSAGESYVMHVDNFQVDQGSVFGLYQDGKGARVEKRARIDLLDLKEQALGEAHFFFKSKIVRGRFFFANPKPVKKMRLNHFLMVDVPTDTDVEKLKKSFKHFHKLTVDSVASRLPEPNVIHEEEIAKVADFMKANAEINPIERSILALQTGIKKSDIPMFVAEDFNPFGDVEPDHLNLFTKMRLSDHLEKVLEVNLSEFKTPIIERAETRDGIEYIQRLCGKSSQQAMNIAIEVIGDMERGTQYPPDYKPTTTGSELADVVKNMIQKISLKKQEKPAEAVD